MAAKHNLFGEVDNRTDGVAVIVQADIRTVDRFSNDILQNAPPASQIKSIELNSIECPGYDSFKIAVSRDVDNNITEISPDIAVCSECLEDMQRDPRRKDYPFINCTNCGPRFSIINDLPYDRAATAMKSFMMCTDCSAEYNNILDRRFHAQPNACKICGPVYRFKDPSADTINPDEILLNIANLISEGRSVAIKGTGGYFLMCDALNNDAVKNLRYRKHRDAKPFAVMFRDISTIRKYCHVSQAEENELKSWRRPIVILKQKEALCESVNSGLLTIGALLPYMPFHYLMFRSLETPAVVLTSGNISGEPIITDDETAEKLLFPVTEAILSYNREIINRVDDSVLRIADNKICMMRRSRGFVPRPVDLGYGAEGILALGAEEKNTFTIGRGRQAIMSQYIGDLKNSATYDFFTSSIGRFSELFRFSPSFVVCDFHPDYLSTQHAEKLHCELNLPLLKVQHHHAHIASCMAEHGIEDEVIGICLDGTGAGTDGNIWGSEFMIADLKNFRRYSHFEYVRVPGGDRAIAEPWRMAFSYIYKYYGDSFDYFSIPAFRKAGTSKLRVMKEMIDKNINSPFSSGAGRLFDAVAALTGLCSVSSFESEGPVRLESAITVETDDYYPFDLSEQINFTETIAAIIKDLPKSHVSLISAKFHNTIARVISFVADNMRNETSIDKVVLSGGVFQNRYLLEKATNLLKRNRFMVFTNHIVPPNDGGISLGQLVIASKTRDHVPEYSR